MKKRSRVLIARVAARRCRVQALVAWLAGFTLTRRVPRLFLSSYMYEGFGFGVCDLCNRDCEYFVYHCSCGLNFHIQCGLFSFNIAEKKIGELQIPNIDLLLSTETLSEKLKEAQCFACWKPLLDSAYLSLDSGFHLHKKCLELPLEINHLFHRQHSLSLQFNSECLPCQICQETQYRGFVYSCSSCKFVLEIACVGLPTKINHLCHRQHPLNLQLTPKSLPCQICQETLDLRFLYCCSIYTFAIHTACVSPTPTIKGEIHEHPFTLLACSGDKAHSLVMHVELREIFFLIVVVHVALRSMKNAFHFHAPLELDDIVITHSPIPSSLDNMSSQLGNANFVPRK
ncbi:C1-like protein [Corchorus olitorius]|uniref:C1-like protein n=1 Tax=Corchorus olitorius TaxID=93759 RepID=A0A1R3I0G1_9ROSI|nr:C1-like protein [Corchorus olitorius]